MRIGSGPNERRLTTCDHVTTITVKTADLAREVCERCGKVSFRFEGEEPEPTEKETQRVRPLRDRGLRLRI